MIPVHPALGGGPFPLPAGLPPPAPHTISYYLPRLKLGMGVVYFAAGAIAMQLRREEMGLGFMLLGIGLVYFPPYWKL